MSEYVSKKEVIEKIMFNFPTMSHYLTKEDCLIARKIYENILEDVEETKTVDVEPVVHGHWCEDEFDVWCSNCYCAYPKDGTGITGWRKISKYCDNCGAKMGESEDEE